MKPTNIISITPKHDPEFDVYKAVEDLQYTGNLLHKNAGAMDSVDPDALAFFLEATSDMLLYTLGWLREVAPEQTSRMTNAHQRLQNAVEGLLHKTLSKPSLSDIDLPTFGMTLAEVAVSLDIYANATKAARPLTLIQRMFREACQAEVERRAAARKQIQAKHNANFSVYEAADSLRVGGVILQESAKSGEIVSAESFRTFLEATNDMLLLTLGWLRAGTPASDSPASKLHQWLTDTVEAFLERTLPLPTSLWMDLVSFGAKLAELGESLEGYAEATGTPRPTMAPLSQPSMRPLWASPAAEAAEAEITALKKKESN